MARRIRENPKGRRFGRWTVLRPSNWKRSPTLKYAWVCRCDCGRVADILAANLRRKSKPTTQCQECRAAELRARTTRHGMGKTAVYRRWYSLLSHHAQEVPHAWRQFEAFVADVGMPPTDAHYLRRVDLSLPYSKRNVCWRTRRRGLRTDCVERVLGIGLTLSDWGRIVGLSSERMRQLANEYGSLAEAFTDDVVARFSSRDAV